MFKVVDGHLVHVPDDARITPALAAIRSWGNRFLAYLHANGPGSGSALEKQYLEGRLSDSKGFEWYAGPDLKHEHTVGTLDPKSSQP